MKRNNGKPPVKSLSPSQRVFVQEYVKCKDGTKAAKVAGYRSPRATAKQLLSKRHIQVNIRRYEKLLEKDYTIRRGLILKEVEDCALRKGGDFVDAEGRINTNFKHMPEDVQAAVDGITQTVTTRVYPDGTEEENVKTNLKLVSKSSALDMAMKHVGGYAPENHQHAVVMYDFDKLYDSMNGSNGAQTHEDTVEDELLELEQQVKELEDDDSGKEYSG